MVLVDVSRESSLFSFKERTARSADEFYTCFKKEAREVRTNSGGPEAGQYWFVLQEGGRGTGGGVGSGSDGGWRVGWCWCGLGDKREGV